MKREKIIRIIVLVGLISTLGLGLYLANIYEQEFSNHTSYRQILITVAGVLLSVIVVITMFYLGKIHDYNRETIKLNAMLVESIEKIRILKMMQSEKRAEITDKLKFILDEKAKQILTDKIKNYELKDDTVNKKFAQLSERSINITKDYESDFSRIPNRIIMLLLLTVGILVISFGVYFTTDAVTIGSFYYLIISIFVTVGSFLYYWYSFESNVKFSTSYLQLVTESIRENNIHFFELENLIKGYDKFNDLVQMIENAKNKS